MHNIWTLIQREYLERVRSRSFIIFTVLMPAFMAGSVLIPAKLAEMNSGGMRKIVIVANDAQLAKAVGEDLGTPKSQASTGKPKSSLGPFSPAVYSIQIDTDPSEAGARFPAAAGERRKDHRISLADQRCSGKSRSGLQHQGSRRLRPVHRIAQCHKVRSHSAASIAKRE